MIDRYNMTIEENIFVVKRNVIDYIWKSANLEGITATYPDTESIYNGLSVSNMKVDDIIAINNLKHAWQFITETTDYELDYPFICELNRKVGMGIVPNAGYIRSVPVSMGGTTWKPDFPVETQIKDELIEVLKTDNTTERAINMMLYCMRKQMFLDGNKRTAMLAANHIMVSNGAGIISVPIEEQNEFRKLLIDFYETGNTSTISSFIYNQCVDGIEVYAQMTSDNTKKNTIINDIKKEGFKPLTKVVSYIEELSELSGKPYTIKDICKAYKEPNGLNDEEKFFIKKIGDEFTRQEILSKDNTTPELKRNIDYQQER